MMRCQCQNACDALNSLPLMSSSAPTQSSFTGACSCLHFELLVRITSRWIWSRQLYIPHPSLRHAKSVVHQRQQRERPHVVASLFPRRLGPNAVAALAAVKQRSRVTSPTKTRRTTKASTAKRSKTGSRVRAFTLSTLKVNGWSYLSVALLVHT